jgi:MFS family permease
MGIGGSIAYVPAMTICSDHFRKHLGYALTAVSCAAPGGTLIVYLLTTLMTNYVSYAWTKFCLAILVLVCMGASNTFPTGSHRSNWRVQKDKEAKRKLKQCFKELALERDEKLKAAVSPSDIPRKKYVCVLVCDVSFCDPFLAVWAGLTLVATCTIFIPYLFLISYAYTLASTDALGLVSCCCLASICTRLVVTNMNNHTFNFNRTVFQLSLIVSGSLYISLNWADTFGWVLLWGLIAGAVEGIECVVIPRVTLQTVPFVTLNASCRWMTFFQACSVILGPMLFLCVYYSTTDYAPAMVSIGIAQLIAAFLVFLMPNVEQDELEELEKQEKALSERTH